MTMPCSCISGDVGLCTQCELLRLRAENEAMEIQAELGITQCKCGRVSMVDAEIERLRAELKPWQELVEKMQPKTDTPSLLASLQGSALELEKLRAENAALIERHESFRQRVGAYEHEQKVARLRAENEELRADAKRARGELLAEDDHLVELNQFRQREPLVRQLAGVCEDCAKPGGDIDMAWRALTQYELENGP